MLDRKIHDILGRVIDVIVLHADFQIAFLTISGERYLAYATGYNDCTDVEDIIEDLQVVKNEPITDVQKMYKGNECIARLVTRKGFVDVRTEPS